MASEVDARPTGAASRRSREHAGFARDSHDAPVFAPAASAHAASTGGGGGQVSGGFKWAAVLGLRPAYRPPGEAPPPPSPPRVLAPHVRCAIASLLVRRCGTSWATANQTERSAVTFARIGRSPSSDTAPGGDPPRTARALRSGFSTLEQDGAASLQTAAHQKRECPPDGGHSLSHTGRSWLLRRGLPPARTDG